MLTVLQVVVFLMGLMSLALSIYYLLFFIRVERRVAKSMVFLMLEQMASTTGTLIFSVNSLVGSLTGEGSHSWNNIDPLVAITLRMAMFGAIIHSNIHLTYSIKNVIHQATDRICSKCGERI